MNCTICGKPIVLRPSAEERVAKDVTGKTAAYYRSLFTKHNACTVRKRDKETRAPMARPNEADIQRCMLFVLDTDPADQLSHAYQAAKRIVCTLRGVLWYDDAPSGIDMSDALGREAYSEWQAESIKANCAKALEMFAKAYPEG